MQLTKTPERLALHPRWKDFVRWPAPVGQGMRWLCGLSLALGLLLGAAQAQVTAPDFRWASRFGSTVNNENMRDMAVDAGGNTYILGNSVTGSAMSFDGPTNLNLLNVTIGAAYLAKYDPSGNPVWAVSLNDAVLPQRVTLDAAGNAYLLGEFSGTLTIGALSVQALAGSRDAFVAKVDAAGTPLWLQRFGGPVNEFETEFGAFNGAPIGGIAVSPAGSLFFTFSFDGSMILDTGGGGTAVLTSGGLQDMAIIKLDLQGNYLGSIQFGGTNSEAPRDLAVDASGDVVVLGVSNGEVTLGNTTVTNAGNGDVFFAKFTSSLQPIFLRGFGGQGNDSPLGLATDPSRNIIMTGHFNSDMPIGGGTLTNQGGLDGFLAKFNPNGQLLWVQQIGGTGDQLGHRVISDAGGFIYLNGRYDSPTVSLGAVVVTNSTGASAIYVMKLDTFGNAFWGQGATASGGFRGTGAGGGSILGFNSGVAYDQLGRFYISGRFEGTATFGRFTFPSTFGSGDMFVASLFSDFDILQHPQDLKVKRADTATFTVVTSTNVPLTFQWLYNGLPIPGATSTNYSITNAQTVNSGIYSVVVSSFTGVLISSNATLTVKLPPVITQNPLSRTVTAGSTVTLSANGAGDGPLSFRWFFNGVALEAFSTSLTLTNVQSANQGLYSLQVSNDVDAVFSAEAGLFINSPPIVTAHPTNQSVTLASNVTFMVASAGLPPFTYQWRHNGNPIPGATSQSYTIAGAQFTNAGIYDVLVGNALSSVFSSNAVLTVLPPFAITPQPVGVATNIGGSATFTVGATGLGAFAGPFTYQWTFNGVPLVGQTAPTLALTGLNLANSGRYACVVDSPLGSQTSSNGNLIVFTPFTVGAAIFQPGGLFQMTASGDDGRAYRLEMTTNLVQWLPIVTNTVSAGTATFTDSTTAGSAQRFYRIVLLP